MTRLIRAAGITAAIVCGIAAASSAVEVPMCPARGACQQAAAGIAVELPSGRAWVTISAGPPDGEAIVATNTSDYEVRFDGFGFEQRALRRFDGVAASCSAGEVMSGRVHIVGTSGGTSLRLRAACGSSLNVHGGDAP